MLAGDSPIAGQLYTRKGFPQSIYVAVVPHQMDMRDQHKLRLVLLKEPVAFPRASSINCPMLCGEFVNADGEWAEINKEEMIDLGVNINNVFKNLMIDPPSTWIKPT